MDGFFYVQPAGDDSRATTEQSQEVYYESGAVC